LAGIRLFRCFLPIRQASRSPLSIRPDCIKAAYGVSGNCAYRRKALCRKRRFFCRSSRRRQRLCRQLRVRRCKVDLRQRRVCGLCPGVLYVLRTQSVFPACFAVRVAAVCGAGASGSWALRHMRLQGVCGRADDQLVVRRLQASL